MSLGERIIVHIALNSTGSHFHLSMVCPMTGQIVGEKVLTKNENSNEQHDEVFWSDFLAKFDKCIHPLNGKELLVGDLGTYPYIYADFDGKWKISIEQNSKQRHFSFHNGFLIRTLLNIIHIG